MLLLGVPDGLSLTDSSGNRRGLSPLTGPALSSLVPVVVVVANDRRDVRLLGRSPDGNLCATVRRGTLPPAQPPGALGDPFGLNLPASARAVRLYRFNTHLLPVGGRICALRECLEKKLPRK